MRFLWDENKRLINLERHGLDFRDAHHLFTPLFYTLLDDRQDYGEDRWRGIGLLADRVIVVIYTEPDDETIRVISLRKAEREEKKEYERFIADELGAGE